MGLHVCILDLDQTSVAKQKSTSVRSARSLQIKNWELLFPATLLLFITFMYVRNWSIDPRSLTMWNPRSRQDEVIMSLAGPRLLVEEYGIASPNLQQRINSIFESNHALFTTQCR